MEQARSSPELIKCGLCDFEGATPYDLALHLVKDHGLDLRSTIIAMKEYARRRGVDVREDLRRLIKDLTGRETLWPARPSAAARVKSGLERLGRTLSVRRVKPPPMHSPKPELAPPRPRLAKLMARLSLKLSGIKELRLRRGEREAEPKERTPAHVIAYRLLAPLAEKLLPYTEDLRIKLRRAGMKVSLRGYVSLMLFDSFVVMAATFAYCQFMLPLLGFPQTQALLLSTGLALLAWAVSFNFHYIYPSIKASSRKNTIDLELPYAVNYMSILASSGVTPERMFRALAELNIPAISQEARDIVRDIELFGYDVFTAVEEAIRRCPSDKFAEILEGMVATARSGGDLRKYLMDEARRLMELRKIESRRATTSLATAAELYIATAVFGPLVFVVLLSIMAMIGGDVFGLSPATLLMGMVYLITPLANAIMLLVIDAYSKR